MTVKENKLIEALKKENQRLNWKIDKYKRIVKASLDLTDKLLEEINREEEGDNEGPKKSRKPRSRSKEAPVREQV